MTPRWFGCLAHAVFALLLAFSATSLTVPGVIARSVAESTPETDDDDREAEVAVSAFSRHAAPDRTGLRVTLPPGSTTAGPSPLPRTAPGARVASADPLGSRLRC
jgi:hypothetical protein